MTPADRLRGAGAGALAGFTGGLFGVGGGIVLIPILTGRLHLTQHEAHGTSLAVIGATALAGLAVYGGAAHVAWGTALLVGIASVVAAPAGARLAARVSAGGLRLAFALFLVVVAIRLAWTPALASHAPVVAGAARMIVDAGLGLAVGLLAGFMGVGGGVLAVPAFVLLFGMDQPTAQGTSLAVILVTAPAGALQHHRQGTVA
ncbi:MAG TPA: sulfite exporter TauE/SafE family protein, partial [Dongiaceae bacterium]|nr:sulfite exporter TauE/SafE family protein [Dongiaceae bacterium]